VAEHDGDRGDFGRRISHRRRELGMSVEAVAGAAHIDAHYLTYLEQSARPTVTWELATKLAGALDTTALALLGSGFDRSPGRGANRRAATLRTLEADECWALLECGGVGRVVFTEQDGSLSALPVNFAVSGNQIVLRTAPDSPLDRATRLRNSVGFEVDRIDEAQRTGWSVLVHGHLHRQTPAGPGDEGPVAVTPWAGGVRDRYLRISVDECSGRRVEVQAPEA
jgi:transcriptional regulator with XRE-family HTH domain